MISEEAQTFTIIYETAFFDGKTAVKMGAMQYAGA